MGYQLCTTPLSSSADLFFFLYVFLLSHSEEFVFTAKWKRHHRRKVTSFAMAKKKKKRGRAFWSLQVAMETKVLVAPDQLTGYLKRAVLNEGNNQIGHPSVSARWCLVKSPADCSGQAPDLKKKKIMTRSWDWERLFFLFFFPPPQTKVTGSIAAITRCRVWLRLQEKKPWKALKAFGTVSLFRLHSTGRRRKSKK